VPKGAQNGCDPCVALRANAKIKKIKIALEGVRVLDNDGGEAKWQ